MDIYDKYKPLRNYIKQFNIEDSLRVIYRYIENLQSNGKFDSDMHTPQVFLTGNYFNKTQLMAPWELEMIVKEVVLHSNAYSSSKKSFLNGEYLFGAIRKLRDLNDYIAGKYLGPENIEMELYRVAHLQFPWQVEVPNETSLTRYYKIFSSKELSEIFEKKFGISIDKFYFIIVALKGFYGNYFAMNIDEINVQIEELSNEDLVKVLNIITISFNEMKDRIKSEQLLNENYMYSFNPLRYSPVIQMDFKDKNSLVCPIPEFLFKRLTEGMYYDLIGDSLFEKYFGDAFEKYVGEVLDVSCTNRDSDTIILHPGGYVFQGAKKEAIDWIYEKDSHAIFIECKVKRLRKDSKRDMDFKKDLALDIQCMVDAVVQTYKNIRDYQEGMYKDYVYKKEKKLYPIVLTLENWYLFNSVITKKIEKMVIEELKKEKLCLDWIKEMPYSFCSMQDFETLMRIVNDYNIENVIGKKVNDSSKKTWDYAGFISENFNEYLKIQENLFPEDYNKIFPRKVKEQLN